MREVVIVGAARTAIGKFGGTLKNVPTRTLGAVCIEEALKRAGVEKDQVDEVIMGCVLQGGLGQNVARQMMLDAGLPVEVPCFTINKVCGSGLRAVELAAQIIKAGDADIIVAGGAENMSSTGYTVLSSINPVKAATNPDDLIWETFFAEGEGEHTLYLLVADNVNEYKLEVVCPDCGDQFDVKGTF